MSTEFYCGFAKGLSFFFVDSSLSYPSTAVIMQTAMFHMHPNAALVALDWTFLHIFTSIYSCARKRHLPGGLVWRSHGSPGLHRMEPRQSQCRQRFLLEGCRQEVGSWRSRLGRRQCSSTQPCCNLFSLDFSMMQSKLVIVMFSSAFCMN